MKVKDFCSELEKTAPLVFQESYDNSGLIIGDKENDVTKILLSLDITTDVITEAINCGANLIISHHPLIFKPLRKLTNRSDTDKCITLAIKNNISIYASHTNMDSMLQGVNAKICEKIGLQNYRILSPIKNHLIKLATYVPLDYLEKVQQELFNAGAGCIGNYSNCSFFAQGTGTYKASEKCNPFAGRIDEFHRENEYKLEVVFPDEITSHIVQTLKAVHPYEEVAFDLFPIKNEYEFAGNGMIGELPEEQTVQEFLNNIKTIFNCGVIRHTKAIHDKIKIVAVCGGSGSFLIPDAIKSKADIFITADLKYHDFFLAENKIILADIGHYESEQFTKELFYELLNKKFYNFAFQISKVNTNPINYL